MKDYSSQCIHFRGIQHDTCKAGVDWRALTGGENLGIANRIPCLRSNESTVACAQCHYPTPAEAAAMEADFQAHTARLREDMALIGAAHTDEPASLVYVCELCDRATRKVLATAPDLMAHLLEVHQVDEAAIKSAKGEMTGHIDATAWHQTDYRFTLADGRALLIKSVRQRRRGADRAVWRAETAPTGRKRSKR